MSDARSDTKLELLTRFVNSWAAASEPRLLATSLHSTVSRLVVSSYDRLSSCAATERSEAIEADHWVRSKVVCSRRARLAEEELISRMNVTVSTKV